MKFLPLVILIWAMALSSTGAQTSLNQDQKPAVPNPDQSQGVSSPSQSQPALTQDEKWIEQVDGSFSIPSFTSNLEPNLGFGGDINVGYRLDRTFCLFIGTGYYQYNILPAQTGTSAVLAYIPLVAILRVTLGDGPFHPYIFGDAGIALNTYVQNSVPGSLAPKIDEAEMDFYLAPGLGILYRFASDMAFFLQSRVDVDFTSPKGLGVPLADPSVFIPLQAGISFFAL